MIDRPALNIDPDHPDRLVAAGDWLVGTAAELDVALSRNPGPAGRIDASGIGRLDSAGALLLLRVAARMEIEPSAIRLRDDHRSLVQAIQGAGGDAANPVDEPQPPWVLFLAHIGQTVTGIGASSRLMLGFLGLTMSTLAATVWRPSQWRITSTVHHMEHSGLNALPLVALLSFLVGAVIAFLGATVLRDFGAELFVVDLTVYAFFREFGVLLTAILLAGRTASAFTAQIGTMKAREEIDAMRTLGLDPIVLLVLPRLIALIVMLPVLAAIATLAGLLGGLVVSSLSLGISPDLFISRMQESLELRHYLVGLAKAPLFATVIALVGCLEGFKVTGTAQSVGERTTSAVVQAISLVIIIDALAAVFFMELGW